MLGRNMRFKDLYRVLLVGLWVLLWAKKGALDFTIAQKAFKSENYTKTLEYYLKAGDRGYAEGYAMAGSLHLGGLKGVEQDVYKALEYLKRAGKWGVLMRITGNEGVTRDLKKPSNTTKQPTYWIAKSFTIIVMMLIVSNSPSEQKPMNMAEG